MKLKTYKVKIKEKDIVRDFVELAQYTLKDKFECLIRIENSASMFNAAYRRGMKKGVADFLFDHSSHDGKYRNLWIEFKANKNKQTPEQIEFQKRAENSGSKYIICYNRDNAIKEIKSYLGYIQPYL